MTADTVCTVAILGAGVCFYVMKTAQDERLRARAHTFRMLGLGLVVIGVIAFIARHH
jgi:hypothetical protein